jgi:hypothetical protein
LRDHAASPFEASVEPLADLDGHNQSSRWQKLAAIQEADAFNHRTRTPANRFADSAV